MRLTNHSGRTHKNGQLFNARHNDRDFDTTNADHINDSKTQLNQYWSCIKNVTFAECEKQVYEDFYADGLEAKNKRYIKQGHKERCQTIEDVLNSPKTAPDETLFYFGNKDEHADPKLMAQCFVEFLKWHDKTFPQIKVLDFALHLDEEGAPHIHARQTYWALDKDGYKIPGQNKAFKDMGILPPNPDKKISQRNNPKMTYSKMCREKLIEIAKTHDLDIVETPKNASKTGLDLLSYQVENSRKILQEVEKETEEQIQVMLGLDKDVKALKDEKETYEKELPELREEWSWYKNTDDKLGAIKSRNKLIKELEARVDTLEAENEQIRANLSVLEAFLDKLRTAIARLFKTTPEKLVSGEYEEERDQELEAGIRHILKH